MEYSLIFPEIDKETYEMIHRLRSHHLRNLAWYLSANSLPLKIDKIHSESISQEWVYRDWLWFESEDTSPENLNTFISEHQKNKRLGFYAENLLLYWFSKNENFKLIESGTQIERDGQTVTEIDFYFQDTISGILHFWETTLKFYLFDTNSNEWVGPGSRDRALLKLKKVNDLQLPQGKEYLQEKYENQFDTSLFIKGRLFSKASENCNWYHLSDFISQLNKFDDFLLIPKNDWMFLNNLTQKKRLNQIEIKEQLNHEMETKNKALVFSQKEDKYQLSFIVADGWPKLFQS